MNKNLKKPCNECPFRRKHPAGWIGPWEGPTAISNFIAFGGVFPCHRTIPKDGLGEASPDAHKMELCAGASIHLNNQCARHRDPEVREHQELVGTSPDVFTWPNEFNKHHESVE